MDGSGWKVERQFQHSLSQSTTRVLQSQNIRVSSSTNFRQVSYPPHLPFSPALVSSIVLKVESCFAGESRDWLKGDEVQFTFQTQHLPLSTRFPFRV